MPSRSPLSSIALISWCARALVATLSSTCMMTQDGCPLDQHPHKQLPAECSKPRLRSLTQVSEPIFLKETLMIPKSQRQVLVCLQRRLPLSLPIALRLYKCLRSYQGCSSGSAAFGVILLCKRPARSANAWPRETPDFISALVVKITSLTLAMRVMLCSKTWRLGKPADFVFWRRVAMTRGKASSLCGISHVPASNGGLVRRACEVMPHRTH
mmetsp:Transcript_113920/g.284976  ORF Transcript_113920/g.284976 Transcript_113920/m.284976 type:complete len:212 (-) Transcript_113920:1294-1929(-)